MNWTGIELNIVLFLHDSDTAWAPQLHACIVSVPNPVSDGGRVRDPANM